ncbi:hypothetical protein [Pedobacter sp. ASV12]|uniref:hypothetical protein n=1 Tax=Pedobacter sp. ASV12 TaxID=2795120 RepID=UPI0018EB22FE|nr:hypothetical protein [Pedobacter sp. ASV12]
MKKPNLRKVLSLKGEPLTRNELKSVLGGVVDPGEGGGGTCTVSVKCLKGAEISCSGSGGACKYENVSPFGTGGWVQCDKDPKVNCA